MMVKPSVAFQSEEQARVNINRKLMRLTALLRSGVLPADTPKSLNQFNAWKFVGDCVDDSFVGNAHETLTRNADLKTAASNLTGLVRKAARPALPVRELSVKRARERAELHLQLRHIAERHALQMMSQNGELRRQIDALRAQVESMIGELATIRSAYEDELQKLRSANADLLRASPSNIRVLRKDV